MTIYRNDRFWAARRSLMLPHPHGEVAAIASAFHDCFLALADVRSEDLDDNARDWVSKLRDLIDTTGLQDPTHRGLFTIKAERLTEGQKLELSQVVDELANWFDSHFWSNT